MLTFLRERAVPEEFLQSPDEILEEVPLVAVLGHGRGLHARLDEAVDTALVQGAVWKQVALGRRLAHGFTLGAAR